MNLSGSKIPYISVNYGCLLERELGTHFSFFICFVTHHILRLKSSLLKKLLCLICRGGFELHRGGKLPEFCGGFQAHLSTYASPKVLEVVNKFSHKISLHEVSRLSTWPSQFYESGANEDNIALYFFAKDNERYAYVYLLIT